ncbi:hypothetical protein IWQ57_005463, partial [Coemansia nantahalensis]
PEPDPQHQRSRVHGLCVQPHGLKGRPLPGERGQGHQRRRRPLGRGVCRQAEAPAQDHAPRQGRRCGRQVHRDAAPASRGRRHCHRRRQLTLPRHAAPLRGADGKEHPLCRLRRVGRRGGRALRAQPDARRQPAGVAAPQAHLPGDCRQGPRRRALLRLGRRRRRRPLCQNGPQRHRVWRHAADLGGLPDHARRRRLHQRPAGRHLCRVEQGRARLVPHRDHNRHPALQGRRRPAAARKDPRRRRPKGHRQVDRHFGPRLRHARHPHWRGRLCALPVVHQGRARARVADPERAPRRLVHRRQ